MGRILVGLAALTLCASASADVKFVMSDLSGQQSTLVSNGSQVRIDNEQMPGFGLIDTERGEYLMVDTSRNEAYSTSLRSEDETDGAKPVQLKIKDKGGGQKIAGYLTRKYRFSADGERCGTIYASKKLLNNQQVRGVFEAFRAMQQTSRRMSAGFAGMLTPCQRANLQLAEKMDSIGVPLLVLGADGSKISEVLSVDTDARVEPSRYEIPSGITVVSMDAQMQNAAEAMQNMPEMSEMMQQMQQNGGEMTPEMQQQMQQQMQQLQEMLQQMQQQQ